MLNRRQLIMAGAGVAVVGLAAGRFLLSTDENAIIAVLRKRLGYLKLDEPGLHAFAKDLVAAGIVSSNRLRFLDAVGPIYTHFISAHNSELLHPLQHGEERVVSLYLLSSDFFVNGTDETQPIRYLHYYDPIAQNQFCRNPFARPLHG